MNISKWSLNNMVDELQRDLIQDLQDPEFAKSYGAECAKSEFGLALFHARQAASLTQQQLAEKMGVRQPYVAQLESGEANPTLSVAGKLLATLGLKMLINLAPLQPQEEVATNIPGSMISSQYLGFFKCGFGSVSAAETILAIPADDVYLRCLPVCTVEPYDTGALPEPRLLNLQEKTKQAQPQLVTVE
jgi:transcriptional regulator with XRE-family HTH domain